MSSFRPSAYLRRALLADAVISGATAALMIAGAGFVESLLGVPATLMRTAGLVLIPFVAFVLHLVARENLAPTAVWAVIACNAAWAAASVLVLLGGFIAPTALGYAFVIAQALVVVVFGELQYVGLRRPRAVAL